MATISYETLTGVLEAGVRAVFGERQYAVESVQRAVNEAVDRKFPRIPAESVQSSEAVPEETIVEQPTPLAPVLSITNKAESIDAARADLQAVLEDAA